MKVLLKIIGWILMVVGVIGGVLAAACLNPLVFIGAGLINAFLFSGATGIAAFAWSWVATSLCVVGLGLVGAVLAFISATIGATLGLD